MLDAEQTRQRTEFIAGLREMADFFDARPDLKTPSQHIKTNINLFAKDKAELLELRRQMGNVVKREWGTFNEYIALRKAFRGGFSIDVNILKDNTCERVKIGEEVVPAKPARTIELPAEPEKTVEKYEWHCNGLLADMPATV